MINNGKKSDLGKTMMSLLMVQFGDLNHQVAEVLTYGATKYPNPPLHDNWKYVENARIRYIDAMYRHLHAYFQGELIDEETGKSHLAHAMSNMHFIYELDKMYADNKVIPAIPTPNLHSLEQAGYVN